MRPRHRSQREPIAVRASIRDAVEPVDILLLAAVPVVLVSVYLLPLSTRRTLVLAYVEPTPVTAFTSHFVHLDLSHLGVNVLTYLVLVPVIYLMCLLSGNRGRFWSVFVTIVFAFPFAVSALNVALVRPRIGLGFSSLLMAFLGFLPIAFVWFVGSHFDPRLDLEHAPALFFVGTGLIALLAVPAPLVAATIAAGSAVTASIFAPGRPVVFHRTSIAALRRAAGQSVSIDLAVMSVIIYVLLPVAAFPSDPVTSSGILNLYGHQIGFCLGFIVPYATYSVLGTRRDRADTTRVEWSGSSSG